MYAVYLPETITPQTLIAKVTIEDADEGRNGFKDVTIYSNPVSDVSRFGNLNPALVKQNKLCIFQTNPTLELFMRLKVSCYFADSRNGEIVGLTDSLYMKTLRQMDNAYGDRYNITIEACDNGAPKRFVCRKRTDFV